MRNALLIASMLLSGCSVLHASALKTGHLIVALTDKETGGPITNATVTVRSCIVSSMGPTLDSHYRNTSAQANSNGIADVEFEFQSNMFDWWVSSPTHHCAGSRSPYEHFNAVVVPSAYTHINTNTVEGLAKYNELKALHESDSVEDYLSLVHKFEPQSVTYTNNVLYRSASFYPKHNPRPMHVQWGRDSSLHLWLPQKHDVVVSNGVEVSCYRVVDFDMKEGRFLPSKNNWTRGKTSDFKIVRYSVVTNEVSTCYGWIEFSPGCGAYKGIKSGDASFPTRVYEADTNAEFQTRIPYLYHQIDGKRHPQDILLRTNEYMVVRTRAAMDDSGAITNCHYGLIEGAMRIGTDLYFKKLIFNPTPNDPNLEAAEGVNLSK